MPGRAQLIRIRLRPGMRRTPSTFGRRHDANWHTLLNRFLTISRLDLGRRQQKETRSTMAIPEWLIHALVLGTIAELAVLIASGKLL
jgi:hypothetical protein